MTAYPRKKRIQFIKNREIQNQIKAERQKVENSFIDRSVTKLYPNHSVFKKRRSLSTDWEPMVIASYYYGQNIDPDTQYIDWEIVLERMDERMIPFINVEVLYRVSDGSINDGANLETPSKIVVFEIEDIEGEGYIKKVIIRASFYFSDGDVELPYQAKLLVNISHPQDEI